MEDGAPLAFAVVVHLVVVPHASIVVDVHHKQSVARQFTVPTLLLAVFKQIILIVVTPIIYNVGVATFVDGLHVGDIGVFGQFDGCFPSAYHALIAGISTGHKRVTVVTSIVHEAP